MDEHNLQVPPQSVVDDVAYEPDPLDDRSAFDRFVEVFTSPREAFTGLRTIPKRTSIILWGLVIGVVVALFGYVVLSTSPDIMRQQQEPQRELFKGFHESGKMDTKQYQEALAKLDEALANPRTPLTLLGIIGVMVLLWTLAATVMFALCRILGPSDEPGVGYSTAYSMYLIALMIPLAESLVTVALKYALHDAWFSISAASLVKTDNRVLHAALDLLNPLTVWWVVVAGIGISVVARTSVRKGIAFWGVTYTVGMLAYGAIQQIGSQLMK